MRLAASFILLFATTAQAGGYHYPVQRYGGYVRTAPAGTTFTNSPFNPQNTTINFTYVIQNPGPTAEVGRTLTYAGFTEPVAFRAQSVMDTLAKGIVQLPQVTRDVLNITVDATKAINTQQEIRLERESRASHVERLYGLSQSASEVGRLSQSLGAQVSVSLQSNGQDIPVQQPSPVQATAPNDGASEIIALTTQHCGRCHGQGGNAVAKFDMTQLGQLSDQEWQYVGISITGGGVADDGRSIPAMPKDDFHSFKYADKMRLLDLIRGK